MVYPLRFWRQQAPGIKATGHPLPMLQHVSLQISDLLSKMNLVLLTLALGLVVAGSPIDNADPSTSRMSRRQDIDFQLVDDSPEPIIAPDNSTNYNQQAAISEVVASINEDPLPQDSTLGKRDMVISTYPGYTENTLLSGAAINAPLNCNGAVSASRNTYPYERGWLIHIVGHLHGRQALHFWDF